MLVTKRDGSKQPWSGDKVTSRIDRLLFDLNQSHVNTNKVVERITEGLYSGVSTFEVDNLLSETAASMTTVHPDYSFVASRVAITQLYKHTPGKFSEAMVQLYNDTDESTDEPKPALSQELYDVVLAHAERLDAAIDNTRDFELNYFGFKTLEKAYLIRSRSRVVERPQYLLMRVAIGIHGNDLDSALETYDLMSTRQAIHASPTLFNAGTCRPQMSSCFLVSMSEDSIEGIYDTLKTCALISKTAGGIGLHVHNIRAAGSAITNNGRSNGLVPMLRVFNNTARYVDQGGNKRPGAFAMYLEPWHADVFEFLDLRKNHGKEENRARDLFYALWIPDLFMKRVQDNEDWCLFCPKDAPGLADVYGEEFEQLYRKYEKAGKARSTIKAQKLWYAILQSQVETGTPYMLYKDQCNSKSNQKNLGTIKSSNLCTEIVEYSAPDEVAVCNLASVALPMFVRDDQEKVWYDFAGLHSTVKLLVKNLNCIIDRNLYPVPEAEKSNKRHRPIAVGVQGLADVFMLFRMPFDCDQARKLNVQIFETIYHAAVEASIVLAKAHGCYETFPGSPASQGLLQYDLWGVEPTSLWNWSHLKDKLAKYGLRNSLLVAPMPTASTSQILGFNECFEPYTSNVYTRRVLSGEFQVVNPHLLKDLVDLGVWNDSLKHRIIADNGSIQNIQGIPEDIKQLYRTVWEIPQKNIVDMAADRGPFIDQSQSMNVHFKDCTLGKLTSMHFYGWKRGLKTGMYYLRTQAASAPIQFTVDKQLANSTAITDKLAASALKKRTYVEAMSASTEVNTDASSPESAATTNGKTVHANDDTDNDEDDDNDDTTETDTNTKHKAQRQQSNGDIYDDQVVVMCTPSMKDCDACSG